MGIENFSNSINSKKNISFAGHRLVEDKHGKKQYQFFLPSDASKANLEAIVVDENGEKIKTVLTKQSSKNASIPIWNIPVEQLRLEHGQRLAYRFKVDGSEVFDQTIKTKDNNYNLATKDSRPALGDSEVIYHLLPDSFNPPETNDRRNHFNKFGTTIPMIIDKLDHVEKLGVKKILGTPILGQDKISSHGYWTTNPYQVTETLGNFNDFQDLQVALFDKDMTWLADGAFVNEGIEGVHIQNIMDYGTDSPFFDWFKTQDFSSKGIHWGVLPKGENNEAKKHFDIKIVNAPYIYNAEDNSYTTKNKNYDSRKPTYLQLYDNRLASEEQQISDEIINVYDNKQTDDPNEIKDYKDAVQPIKIKINPEELELKIKEAKRNKNFTKMDGISQYRNALLKWNNFSLVESNKDSTIQLWCGNKDIAKLQFTNPQVTDYIRKTGEYWTDETDKIVTKYIASKIADAVKNDDADAINKLYGARISDDSKISKEIIQNAIKGKYDIELAHSESQVNDQLRAFPLDAVEFPPEIVSILSMPSIKGLDGFENKKLNEDTNKIYENEITPLIKDIISDSNQKNLLEDGELTEEGKDLFRLVSSDVMRYVAGYAIGHTQPKVEIENGKTKIVLNNLKENTYKNIDLKGASPEENAVNLLNKFNDGVKNLKNDENARKDLKQIISKGLEGIDHDVLKVSKVIIDKSGAGLGWRIDAAKDVTDVDAVIAGKKSFDEAWDEVIGFWKGFNDSVRKYNANAYTIGEVTNVNSMTSAGPSEAPEAHMGKYYGLDAAGAEKRFIEETGFTTQSNYSYFFSTTPQLVHGAPEGGAYKNYEHKDLSRLLGGGKDSGALKQFLESGPTDNTLLSHNFPGNHDKPRINHSFAVDIEGFFTDANKVKAKSTILNEIKESEIYNVIDDALTKQNEKENNDWWTGSSDLGKQKSIYDSLTNPGSGNWMRNDKAQIHDNMSISVDEYQKMYDELQEKANNIANADKSDNLDEAITVGTVFEIALEKSNEFEKLKDTNPKAHSAIVKALSSLEEGKILDKDGKVIQNDSIADHFAKKPLEHTINDIINQAKKVSPEAFGAHTDGKMSALKKEVLRTIMAPAFEKFKAMYQIYVALPGNPTIYAGDEFGMTGFETPDKNVYQHNRQPINWEWVGNGSEAREEVKKLQNSLIKIMSLRAKPELSPLKNGATVNLGLIDGKPNLGAIYRYNTKSDVITLINTEGFDNTKGSSTVASQEIDGIPLSSVGGIANKDKAEYKALFLNKNGEVEQKQGIYVINDGKLVKKTEEGQQKEKITIDTPVLYFYRSNNVEQANINNAIKAMFVA